METVRMTHPGLDDIWVPKSAVPHHVHAGWKPADDSAVKAPEKTAARPPAEPPTPEPSGKPTTNPARLASKPEGSTD